MTGTTETKIEHDRNESEFDHVICISRAILRYMENMEDIEELNETVSYFLVKFA
jgi:hypothetical protein